MHTDLELWHVQLGGIVRTMTIDELDNAFQSGVIDEGTNVLRAGATRWMTLGQALEETPSPAEAAEIDVQPNSIAPFATDIASDFSIPPQHNPNFDVSFGTEELQVFKPKRRIGRAFAVVALVASIGGGLFAVKSYGTANLRAKASQIASLIKKPSAPSMTAAAAAMAPPAPVDLSKPSTPTTSMNSLPAVGALGATNPPPPPPDKNAKKKVDKKPAKGGSSAASRKANANDPTTKGSTDKYDPLNGKI